jgi:hypothetical protein
MERSEILSFRLLFYFFRTCVRIRRIVNWRASELWFIKNLARARPGLEARAARFSLFSQLHYCGFSAAAAFIDFRVERAEAGSRALSQTRAVVLYITSPAIWRFFSTFFLCELLSADSERNAVCVCLQLLYQMNVVTLRNQCCHAHTRLFI